MSLKTNERELATKVTVYKVFDHLDYKTYYFQDWEDAECKALIVDSKVEELILEPNEAERLFE